MTGTTTKKTAASPKPAAKSPKPEKKPTVASPKKAVESPKKSPVPSPSPKKRKAGEVSNVKPKRALSAYFMWLNENRKMIIDTKCGGSGSDVAAVSKAAGVMWSAMSDAAKKPYQDKADKDKIRYAEEMKSYVPDENSEPKKKKGKKGKKEKDPNKPKKATTAYFFWLNENRKMIIDTKCGGSGSDVAAVSKAAGVMWTAMSDAAKKPYQAKAEKDKLRYEAEMKSYVPPAADDDEEDDE